MEKVTQESSTFNGTVEREAPSITSTNGANGTKSLRVSLVDFFQVFRNDPAELIEFRAIAAKKCPPHLYRDWEKQTKPPLSKTLAPASFVNLTDTKPNVKALAHENERRGVFWIVNPGGNEDADIKRFVAAIGESDPPEGTDADEFKKAELAKERPLLPSVQMLTKKSVHDYWLIDGDCSREEWIIIQQGIIGHFGSDPTISNESRVMRIPNTQHVSVDFVNDCLIYKPIELVTFEPTRKYTVSQLMNAFPCPEDGFIIAFDKLSQDKYKSRGIAPSAELTARVEEIKARRKADAKAARAASKAAHPTPSAKPAPARVNLNSKVTTLQELIDRQKAGDTTLVPFKVEPVDYTDTGLSPREIEAIEGTLQRQCWRLANTENGKRNNTLLEVALIVGGLVKSDYADRDRCKELLMEAVAETAANTGVPVDPAVDAKTIENGFSKAREISLDELLERTWIEDKPQSDNEFYAAFTQNPVPLAREVWAEMDKAEREHPRVFWYSDLLSRLTVNKSQFKIQPLTPDMLAYRLAYLGKWYTLKVNKTTGEEKRVYQPAPGFIVKHLLAAPAEETPIPVLKRITDIPVFDPEGNLIDKEGFHRPSGIFYQPAFKIESIPQTVTRADVDKAKAIIADNLLLNDRVKGFPFSSKADHHNAIACLLTPFVREMIIGPTPLFLAEASLPRSGKGLLIESILQVAFGGKDGYEMMTYSPDHQEMSKRLTAALIAGKGGILIDNINHTIDSGELCSVLTGTHHNGRILGVSKLANVEIKSLFTATANNPTMSQEIAGRVISIRLTPDTDKPEERTGFLHENLTEWISENRPQLVRACLILCKAWIQRGKPKPSGPILGRYESFISVVGGILETLGFDSFMTNRAAFTERADTERSSRSELAHAWFQKADRLPIGMDGIERTKPLTASEILEKIGGKPEGLPIDSKYKDERTGFGYYLVKQHDIMPGYVGPETDDEDSRTISARYRIVLTGKKKRGSNTFQVELLEPYTELSRPDANPQPQAEPESEPEQAAQQGTDEGPDIPQAIEQEPETVAASFPQEEWGDDWQNPHF